MSRAQFLILTVIAALLSSASLQADDKFPEAGVTDKPNVVISPYPPNNQIDITGFLPGDLARDPHTGKIFRVPPKRSKPVVMRPEIIEEPEPEPEVRKPGIVVEETPETTDPLPPLEGNPVIRRPEIIEEPDAPVTPTDPTLPRPPAVPADPDRPDPSVVVETTPPVAPPVPFNNDPEKPTIPIEPQPLPTDPEIVDVAPVEPEVPVEPILPVRDPREIDAELTEFIEIFIRSGQNNDPSIQAKFLAPTVRSFYTVGKATKEEVITAQTAYIETWSRRIFLMSGKPRFVRWMSEREEEDEFVVDVRVYRSLKSTAGKTKRGYSDHRFTVRQKSDGSFEITGAQEAGAAVAARS